RGHSRLRGPLARPRRALGRDRSAGGRDDQRRDPRRARLIAGRSGRTDAATRRTKPRPSRPRVPAHVGQTRRRSATISPLLPMPYVEYACEGRLLFRTETTEGSQFVPRVHEIVVIDDAPYQVVDVEYWARKMGATDRRFVWPT